MTYIRNIPEETELKVTGKKKKKKQACTNKYTLHFHLPTPL